MQMDSVIYGLRIGQCENQDEYESLVREHQTLYKGWSDFIMPRITAKRLKQVHIARGCGISRPVAAKFTTSIPTDRRSVIMLAMMLNMTVAETDEMLVRWAKFQRLYPKHPEDAIWVYLLRRGGSSTPKALFDAYYAVYKQMLETAVEEDRENTAVLDTYLAYEEISADAETGEVDPTQDPQFRRMMMRLIPSFRYGYARLMNYIDDQFRELDFTEYTRVSRTPNQVFQKKKHFLRKYYEKIMQLRKDHTVPSRMFLIALGIHLNLDTDRINTLLELAGMGPLCPKDRLEGSIAFYLEELCCQLPSAFRPQTLEVDPVFNQLQDDPAGATRTDTQLDVLLEEPEEQLADYLRRRLEETNIFGEAEQKSLQDLLQML